MSEEQRTPLGATDGIARRLVNETDITDAQARELIALLGPHNWTSLLREARILNPKGA